MIEKLLYIFLILIVWNFDRYKIFNHVGFHQNSLWKQEKIFSQLARLIN